MAETFELSPQQKQAALKIKEWFADFEAEEGQMKPIFRLFGFAGTGKTTTIRYIIEELELEGDVLFAAYTGKAAMVMRKNGLEARTIHSLIYEPVPPDAIKCSELQKKLKAETDEGEKKRIRVELKEAGRVHFALRAKKDSDLRNARLLVLDECSMVNDDMLQDLLTFKVPMLVLGDPGQLPPIDGTGALVRDAPDAMLTEIHRQALDNPIINLSLRARNGVFIPFSTFGTSKHVKHASLTKEQVFGYDQILCGKNFTRIALNQRVREVKGFEDRIYPCVGDRLVCLKNDAQQGLFNGMMCDVLHRGELLDTSIELTIRTELGRVIETNALRAHFDVYHDKNALDNVKWWEKMDANEFDFGYCITVHKAQGSQWDSVLLWDDKFFVWDKDNRKKWLYTAITRAVDNITLASK